MMNDMMPTIEETITPDIAAQIEHEEWQRDLRNEFAVEKSKEIMKLFNGSWVPHI